MPTLPSGYTIDFVSAPCTVDPVLGVIQTFTYSLTVPDVTPPACEISNFAIELCDNHVVVASTTPNNTPVVVESNFPLQPCMSTLDPTAQAQIKFDGLNDQNAGGLYTFTLLGCFPIVNVQLALKVGDACPLGTCQGALIAGPDCQEGPPPPPPPGRGVEFDKIGTLTEE